MEIDRDKALEDSNPFDAFARGSAGPIENPFYQNPEGGYSREALLSFMREQAPLDRG